MRDGPPPEPWGRSGCREQAPLVGDALEGVLAEPGQTLVTSTVKEIMAGAGIAFVPRGQHTLKGVPDEWRLFAAP